MTSLIEALKTFLIALPFFILFDYLWLAHIAKKFYLSQLAPIIKVENGSLVIHLGGAVMVYLIGILALHVFVDPASKTPYQALFAGAFLGFILYGFYDFTNYATLKTFPLSLVFVDILWGTFLFGLLSILTVWILNFWK